LAKPPATVYDVGGAAGIYALWLAQLGYDVHLIDLLPLHIEQAILASKAQPAHPLVSAHVGNALHLDFPDASADAVLLMGPLYHLQDRADRLQALREAYRVLKPSGYVCAVAISRFASLLDGLNRGYLADDRFYEITRQDLRDGRHNNPGMLPGYFTTAYLHSPHDLQAEVEEAGFQASTPIAVEGPAGFMPDLNRFWEDAILREQLLHLLRTTESEPTMLGATGHLMVVGQAPSQK